MVSCASQSRIPPVLRKATMSYARRLRWVMRVEDEYLDVLQNLEFAIVTEFRKDGAILDLNVLDAVNALVRHYEAEMEGRKPPDTG